MKNRYILTIASLIILLIMLPDFSMIGLSYFYTKIPNNWDSANLSFWGYLISKGDRPMVDFWYPYFGQYLFNLKFPYGAIFYYVNISLIFIFLLYGVIKNTKGYAGIIIVILILLLVKANTIPAFERYLWGVNLILVYVAIDRGLKIDYLNKIIFNCLTFFLFFFEPSLVIYSVPAIFFLIILDFVIYKKINFIDRITDFISIIFILTFILFLKKVSPIYFDALIENFILTSLGSSYGSYPINKFNFYTYIIFLYLVIGFYFIKSSSTKQIGAVILSVAIYIISILVIKDSLRPIGRQLDSLIIFLSFFIIFHISTKKIYINFFIGIIIAWVILFTSSHRPSYNLESYKKLLSNNIDLIGEHDKIQEYRIAQYSIDRLSDYKSTIDLYENLSNNGIFNNFYVYGDIPLLYLVAETKYPFIQNIYNSSPYKAQEKIVNWLIINDINYIVFDSSQLTWDGVQNVVRTSIIFNYINFNYKFYYKYKNFIIFKKTNFTHNNASEIINIFSNQVNLGKIYNNLSKKINDKNICSSGDLCKPFLKLSLKDNFTNINLYVNYQGNKYIINLSPDEGSKDYLIPINSLWFVNNNNLSLDISSDYISSYAIQYYNFQK